MVLLLELLDRDFDITLANILKALGEKMDNVIDRGILPETKIILKNSKSSFDVA